MKFVIIPELKGCWIWELRGPDGVPVSRSPRRFTDKAEVISEIRKVRLAAGRAQIFDLVGELKEEVLAPTPGGLVRPLPK